MIDFYRKTYNLTFSNGGIFTVESLLKRKEFLLNKVAHHARNYKQELKPLIVGNLDSYRNILHAKDVAKAIHVIISQETGDNYLICNEVSYKMYDLVVELYKKMGITNDLPLIIENEMFGFDVVHKLNIWHQLRLIIKQNCGHLVTLLMIKFGCLLQSPKSFHFKFGHTDCLRIL